MNKTLFDFHADDYAVSLSASRDINKLGEKGAIESISIIPNMSAFAQSVSAMSGLDDIKKSVHLNFMEGKSCLPKEAVPDLVDDDGCFKISWGSLLLSGFKRSKRMTLKKQLAAEIVAQVEKCIGAGVVAPDALRLDSHQHTHMIPLVQEALFEAISQFEEKGRKVVFVRNTEDPLSLYFRSLKTLRGFSFTNMLKCMILNHFSRSLKKKLKILIVSYFYSFRLFRQDPKHNFLQFLHL